MRGQNLERLQGYLFLAPYLALFLSFTILPLAFGLGLSLFEWEMLSPAPPRFIGLGNYAEAVHSLDFWRAAWATFRFVFMTVPAVTLGGLALAVLIDALPRRRQAFFRASYFLPTLISISVAGILWRWFYGNEFGLFNELLEPLGLKVPWVVDPRVAMKSLVLMTVWWTIGAPMVILLAGLQQIPAHYYEAAAIDGASRGRQFFHVTLPLLRPVLLFVIVMNTIASFQVFGQPFIIPEPPGGPEYSTRVLVQYIYENAFTFYRMGFGAAMSWLLFIPIMVFSVIQFRLLREKA